MPTVAAKTLGGAGTAYGTYRAAKALKNMYQKSKRNRKAKSVLSRPKRSTKFKRLKPIHYLKIYLQKFVLSLIINLLNC
jgi:hypothetical protein